MKKTGALAGKAGYVLSSSQKVDCVRTKCSYRVLFDASFEKRDSFFFGKCFIKPRNLFIDDRKQMI